jgi:hypothetical protein
MLKSIIVAATLTIVVVAPSGALAAVACDDATISKAQSTVNSMSTKRQSKFSGKLQEAKEAKQAGKNGKCAKMLANIIGKSH